MSNNENFKVTGPAKLLDWYDRERRILPWREDPTPYHVWISEIMLQQTRVEAVMEYYKRFLATCPDIASLAAADEATYMKLWEGLGYYSRIRNFHKAAVAVMEEHDGVIPGTAEELRKLPGIGEYIAAAISSIAFGQPNPSVDGNLLRVWARMNEDGDDILGTPARKKATAWYQEMIPHDRPGDFNQALMDIGATICLPNTEPHCDQCPWKDDCPTCAHGSYEKYPYRAKKTKNTAEKITILLLEQDGKVWLHRRPEKGLLAGLTEFPNEAGHLTKKALKEWLAERDLKPAKSNGKELIEALPAAKHVFSHKTWQMKGYHVVLASGSMPEADNYWAEPIQTLNDSVSMPTAFSAYRKFLTEEKAQPETMPSQALKAAESTEPLDQYNK